MKRFFLPPFSLVHKNTVSSLSNLISPDNIRLNLHGKTKGTVINELLDILSAQEKLLDRATVLKVLMNREQTMSTAIPNGIAIPHAKTNTVQDLTVAVGIKKSGLDFDSALDDKTHIIVLTLASPEKSQSLYEFLLVITAALNDDPIRSKLLAAETPAEISELLHQYH
jgi:mannitol/fructose-specific phosphotransferase system IIA component (Ntr-type)